MISQFFEKIRFPYTQIMLVVWHMLFWVNHLNKTEGLDLGLPEIDSIYNLLAFGSSYIIF